jgi:hypothetical protein
VDWRRVVTPDDVQIVARAIKSRVDVFSDRRLNDGDDVWEACELELRAAVAATANAIAVELADSDETFDLVSFATACGLYVSDGRDNYSDCHPGELTWERPRDAVAATPAPKESSMLTDPEKTVSDHALQAQLPDYNGWSATYEYPGFINYAHPDGEFVVCASSDFNGDAKLDIQIQTADFGKSLDDGENEPWPHEGRTAEKMFARIRPYLDKYHPTTNPSTTNPSKEP